MRLDLVRIVILSIYIEITKVGKENGNCSNSENEGQGLNECVRTTEEKKKQKA